MDTHSAAFCLPAQLPAHTQVIYPLYMEGAIIDVDAPRWGILHRTSPNTAAAASSAAQDVHAAVAPPPLFIANGNNNNINNNHHHHHYIHNHQSNLYSPTTTVIGYSSPSSMHSGGGMIDQMHPNTNTTAAAALPQRYAHPSPPCYSGNASTSFLSNGNSLVMDYNNNNNNNNNNKPRIIAYNVNTNNNSNRIALHPLTDLADTTTTTSTAPVGRRGASGRRPPTHGTARLFVGQIPRDVTADDLADVFGCYGDVMHVKILDGSSSGGGGGGSSVDNNNSSINTNNNNSSSASYYHIRNNAFVTYATLQEADAALLALHDVYPCLLLSAPQSEARPMQVSYSRTTVNLSNYGYRHAVRLHRLRNTNPMPMKRGTPTHY